eukprot:3006800-Prymnesium_polylepis.1
MAARRRAGGGGQHARRNSRTQARGRHGRATQMHIVSWPAGRHGADERPVQQLRRAHAGCDCASVQPACAPPVCGAGEWTARVAWRNDQTAQ